MTAADHLRSLLARSFQSAASPYPPCQEIELTLKRLQAHVRTAGSELIPVDRQREAVSRFWSTSQLESLRDARLVSFGLSLPYRVGSACILDDKLRFSAFLSQVDAWRRNPKSFRRCFHGLVASYFSYDGFGEMATTPGRDNWSLLRAYLAKHLRAIRYGEFQPDWVLTALESPHLFSATPCDRYGLAMLRGDNSEVERVRANLAIGGASWFVRELVRAQVTAGVKERDEGFLHYLPHLLRTIEREPLLRDHGLQAIIDRYVGMAHPAMHPLLRDHAVTCWGSPWLASNQVRWSRVSSAGRAMITEWLKLQFIEDFFTLLAEEGAGDRRRMEFWKRYVHAIETVQFALGSAAVNSRSADFLELRRKLRGLTVGLRDSSDNNAFVMRMGSLVIVGFSRRANALYGYDASQGLPFDMTRDVRTAKNAPNSLKSDSRVLWLKYQDGIHGFGRWEEYFESILRRFGIEPKPVSRARRAAEPVARPRPRPAPPPATPPPTTPPPPPRPPTAPAGTSVAWWELEAFSRCGLDSLAKDAGLRVVDETQRGGNLWVLGGGVERPVANALLGWGFKYKAPKGWYKECP